MSDKQGIPDPIGTDITADERAVRKAAFHTILDGEAIDRAGLVVATGLAPERVELLSCRAG